MLRSLGCGSDAVGSLEHPFSPEEKLRHRRIPTPTGNEETECVILWSLISRKGNRICVNDSSVAPGCA